MDVKAQLVRVACGRGALDLALGETLLKLFDGDRLLQLGYALRTDYARERLGVAARTMYGWTALARGVASRPLLRQAVQSGEVTARKALIVMEAATGEREATWVAAATSRTERELDRAVRDGGFDPAADDFAFESIVLRMSAAEQDRLDAALELAREVVGPATPRWMRLEAICQEFLGEFGVCEAGCAPDPGQLAHRAWESAGNPTLPTRLPDAAADLDARARALVKERWAREEELGRLLLDVREQHLYDGRFEDFVRNELGIAPRTARQRIWLERRLRKLPPLRRALKRGRITLTKAQLIAKQATTRTVRSLIAEAESTSCQQLDRQATEEEDRQNRAAGKRRLWGPIDVIETVLHAVRIAQGDSLRVGEALAAIADHFVVVWSRHRTRARLSSARWEVLTRHRGHCAVPGCSAAAAHEHHIDYRSHGGSHDLHNRVALCVAHHLRCIHGGLMTVRGRAGERLSWRFGDEAWITYGDDDVRRADLARERAPEYKPIPA